MAVSAILAFWFVALLLIVVPGADWAFTLGASLRGHAVLPAVAGLVIGYAAMTIVVAAGVGALVAGSPAILTGLTTVGGAYLIWHGAGPLARPPTPRLAGPAPAGAAPATSPPPGTDWQILVRGIGVSGLNPKGLLIFLALLPQFTDPHRRWPVAGQIAVLGATFMVTCGLFYLGLGAFARRVLTARPVAARVIGRVSGAAMIVIGAALLVDRWVGHRP